MRPNVIWAISRLAAGQNNWIAATKPTSMPTMPHKTVANAKSRTIRLS